MAKEDITSLHIPDPCTEDWQHMSPVACGKYCTKCDKIVVDATALDENVLLQLSSGSDDLCLRLRRSQLDRKIVGTGDASPFRSPFPDLSLMLFQELQHGGLMGVPTIGTMNTDGPAQYLMGYIAMNEIRYHKDIMITISEIGYAIPDALGWFQFLVPMSAKEKPLQMNIHLDNTVHNCLRQNLTIERSSILLLPTEAPQTFQQNIQAGAGRYQVHFRQML